MAHSLEIDEAAVERLLPWEYVQRTMAMAGLGLWRAWRPPERPGVVELIFNDSFISMIGYDRADFPTELDTCLERLFHPRDGRLLKEFIEAKIAGRESNFYTIHRLRHGRTGQWRWMKIYGEFAGYADSGRPLYVFGCLIDVQETTASREELQASEANLKAEKEALEKQMAGRNRILDDIRRSVAEFMDDPGRRRDEVQKSLREDMGRQLDILSRGGEGADESFRRYLTQAFQFIANERVWYKAVLDNLPFPTSVFDQDRRWTYLNPAAIQVMGGEAADYLGRPYAEGWRETQDSREPGDDDRVRTFTRQLKNRFFSGRGTLLEDNQGRGIGFIETLMDITRAQEAEDRTRAAQEKLERERLLLKAILDGCPVPFVILADGLVQFATPFARADLGLEVGSSLADLTVDSLEMANLEGQLAANGAANWQPLKLRKPDGSICENLLNAYEADFEGRQALMAWLMDVTQLRRNERELSVARDQAEASTRAKNDFLANMSHEIRTPMNAIIGFNNLLLETELDSQQIEFVEKTNSAAKSLLHTLSDILDFYQLESGKLELAARDFHLQNVLKKAVDLVGGRIKAKGLEFMILVAPNTPAALVGDEYRLLQVLNNILDNAVKFTEHGEISLTIETLAETETEATLLFMIRDTGTGMDLRRIKKLFAPFTQVDTSFTRRHGGIGLGLAISRKLVNMMDGEIWGESEPGRGSTFGFIARFGRYNHAERFIGPCRDFTGRSALIVDDSQMSRFILGKYLQTFGFEVHGAASGQEALDTLARLRDEGRRPDLVTMDLVMPGWDGLETTRRLNETVPEPRLQVILTTAHSNTDTARAAAEAGIRTVLEKPVSAYALLSVLNILFETGTAPGPGTAPLFAAEQERKLARAAKGRNAPNLVRHLVGARILLVEDNEVNQMVAKKILKKAGLEVAVANNGQEALNMVKADRYDLVLMDIQMPVMDGLTAAREIRRLAKGADLPIVALTAHARTEDRKESFSAGMNDHLTKPLDINDLFRCLDKWIKTGPGGRSDQPACGQ
jgi:CheY-like chemotaxis protein/signal transduction histidine kinase